MPEELIKICTLLDKLTLEALILMEQHMQAKVNLEKAMSDGESSLAKSRYIMGHRSVSALQLPTEGGPEVEAVARVHSTEDEKLFGEKTFDVEIQSKDCKSYYDPMKWFGVLVPQDLHRAQESYRRALLLSMQSANIQTRLHQTCLKVKQLREYKLKLLNQET